MFVIVLLIGSENWRLLEMSNNGEEVNNNLVDLSDEMQCSILE